MTNILDSIRLVSDSENEAHAAVLASLLNTDAVARRALGLPNTFNARDVQRLLAHFRDYVPEGGSSAPVRVSLPRVDGGSANQVGPQAVADALRI